MSEARTYRRTAWAVGVCYAIVGAVVLLELGGPAGSRAFNQAVQPLTAILTGVVCLARAQALRGRVRIGWLLLAGASLAWSAGQAAGAWNDQLREGAASGGLADVGHLFWLPLAVAAIIALFPPLLPRPARLRAVMDGLIVGAAFVLIASLVFVKPLVEEAALAESPFWTAVAFPLGAVVLAAVALYSIRARPRPGPVQLLVVAGLLFLATADLWYAALLGGQAYSSTDLVVVSWLVGNGLLLMAALRPGEDKAVPDEHGHPDRVRLLAPYLPVVVAFSLVAGEAAGDGLGPALLLGAAAVFALVALRQVMATLDYLTLARTLEQRVQERTEALARTEGRFRSLIQNVGDIISVVDPDGEVRFCSPAVTHILEADPRELLGRRLVERVHPEDVEAFEQFLAQLGAVPGRSGRVQVRLCRLDGEWRHLETFGVNLVEDPSVEGLVLTSRDVTERVLLEEQLTHQALHDPLTGLGNRVLFADRVALGLAATRREGTAVAVLLIDLDGFKTINDSLGHAAGDELLLLAAERLQARTRAGDTVARLGGDEFAVLVTRVTGPEAAELAAQRLLDGLQAPYVIEGQEVFVGASIGVALGGGAETAADLLRNADVAMYAAKAAGKGTIAAFAPALSRGR